MSGNLKLELKPDGFYDVDGRKVFFRGVNVSANAKFPPHIPFEESKWWDLLALWGFNMIRLTLFWEAIEPHPGVFNEPYLNKVCGMINEAKDHEIFVLLDMHQDLYSRYLGGDGAPFWSLPGKVQKKLNNKGITEDYSGQCPLPDNTPVAWWGTAYLMSGDVKESFTNFFKSSELRQHYINAFLEIARKVKDNSNVIGYDIMNEPSCGNLPFFMGEFENDYLRPFYEEVISNIRKVHPEAIGFVEPHGQDMYTSKLSHFNVDGLVYAPHLYDHAAMCGRYYNPFSYFLLKDFMILHILKANMLRMPLFIGEFGDTWKKWNRNDSVDQAYRVLEESFASCAYWDFSVKDVDKWNEEDYSLIDTNGNPRGLEVNVRPYIRYLSGTPEFQFFKYAYRSYYATFKGKPGLPAVIYIPKIHYPKGPKAKVSDGSWEYKEERSEIWYTPKKDGAHRIDILPK
jgi:endoglycosylceramidase